MSEGAERYMRLALALAARGAGETNPNPMVGCVVVKGRRIVGEGWHRRAGGPHAEVIALERAGREARGATLYLTLEPCSHQGRTPACAPALVAAGIARVVVAMRDPNPRVRGRGTALLRRSGVAVSVGLLEREARVQNQRFLVAVTRPRPFVLLKAGLSLDGRTATASGESKWITSSAQRREARRLRRLHDAVMVGIGTVLADDPGLMPAPRLARPFHRVVLDSKLRLPLGSRLVQSARRSPVWVVCHPSAPHARRRALEARGVKVVPVLGRGSRPDLPRVLAELKERGIWSLMVEGGSDVLGSFLRSRLFDQVALFRGPLLLGGRRSRPAFGGPEPRNLAAAVRLRPEPSSAPSLFELWSKPPRNRK